MSLCVLTHRNHKPHQATDGQLCDHHATALNETLTDIADLHRELHLEAAIPLAATAPSAGNKHTKSAEAPAPTRLDILALTDQRNYNTGTRDPGDQEWWAAGIPDLPNVTGTLHSWARTVCEERGLDGNTLTGTLDTTIAFLRAHRGWINDQPWIDEYHRELTNLRGLLAALLGNPHPTPVGKDPTLNGDGQPCGGNLWPDHSMTTVTCQRCNRHFDQDMLRHLGGMLAA